MADEEEREDELRLWAELRPANMQLVLVFQHNGYGELSLTFSENGETKQLLLAEGQWKMLKSFLKNNR